jgi:hypothetical protein
MRNTTFVIACGALLIWPALREAFGYQAPNSASLQILPSWGAAVPRPDEGGARQSRRPLQLLAQRVDDRVQVSIPPVQVPVPDMQVVVQEPEIEVEAPDVEVEAPDVEIETPDIEVEPDVDIDIDHEEGNFTEHDQEKIQKSFAMPSAHRTLEIDNVWGSIEVVGNSSDQVQLTVNT